VAARSKAVEMSGTSMIRICREPDRKSLREVQAIKETTPKIPARCASGCLSHWRSWVSGEMVW